MKRRPGFSIIELLMVIVIIGALFSLGGILLSVGFTGYFSSGQMSSNASHANIAMANIMRDIQSASSITSLSSGATLITYVNHAGDSVVISLTGTTLSRDVSGGGAKTLCMNISSATVGFFAEDLSRITLPAQVSLVRFVTLKLVLTNRDTSYSLMDGTLLRTRYS